MSKPPIFNPQNNKHLDKNKCFLCGIKINKTNKTNEHIFPKWLLNEYSLWDKALTLPNGKLSAYRNIKIPCCKKCNNVYLSKLENKVKKAIKGGYDKLRKINRKTLFLWLLKIFYELLYMDLSVYSNPANKKRGTILSKKDLKRYALCHTLLQGTRMKLKIKGVFPWSIFIFPTQDFDDKKLNFDYKDDIRYPFLSIRLSNIGIIAFFLENNEIERFFNDKLRKYKRMPLHPLQFDELTAITFYKRRIMIRVPNNILAINTKEIQVLSSPVGGLGGQIYNAWSTEEFAKHLSLFSRIPFEKIYHAPTKQICTFLKNKNGQFIKIDAKTFKPPYN